MTWSEDHHEGMAPPGGGLTPEERAVVVRQEIVQRMVAHGRPDPADAEAIIARAIREAVAEEREAVIAKLCRVCGRGEAPRWVDIEWAHPVADAPPGLGLIIDGIAYLPCGASGLHPRAAAAEGAP